MQLIGNSRGRAIYEAQVSEDFRRPQTDSQLEVFIRAKYEKKKYIAREWIPAKASEYPLGWWEKLELPWSEYQALRSCIHSMSYDCYDLNNICIWITVRSQWPEYFINNSYPGRQAGQ